MAAGYDSEVEKRLKEFEQVVADIGKMDFNCDRSTFCQSFMRHVSGIREMILYLTEQRLDLHKQQLENLKRKTAEFMALEEYQRNQTVLQAKQALQKELQAQLNEYKDMIMKLTEACTWITLSTNEKIKPSSSGMDLMGRCILKESRKMVQGLPIYASRTEIVEALKNHQYIVLKGETGSGKSTQVPQYILEGVSEKSKLATLICTQPRKVAAISLAKRVALEQFEAVGKHVRYWVGMNKVCGDETKLVFMTDRMLLNYCLENPNLDDVGCVIIDEAHERSVNIDLVLSFVKTAAAKRSTLKVVVTSATISTKLFSEYFYNCPVFEIPGRTFPVEVRYEEQENTKDGGREDTYIKQAAAKAVQVHESEGTGDILVFLTSPLEVEKAIKHFHRVSKKASACTVLPLHGKLQPDEQMRVFETVKDGSRKIVFSTNVAETSVTIPGIKFVIDTGRVKEKMFDAKRGNSYLEVKMVSKSSAIQRMGRAGRTGPGICIRLYSQGAYEKLDENTEPEIKKMHLASAVLSLMALGIHDVKGFDFIERPDDKALETSLDVLRMIGAVDWGDSITTQGKKMAKLPVDPRTAKIVLDGLERGCKDKSVILAAATVFSSNIYIRFGSEEDKEKSDIGKLDFCKEEGDLLTIVDIFEKWNSKDGKREQNKWCVENFVNAKSMRSIKELEKEIKFALREVEPSIKPDSRPIEEERTLLKRLITSAFYDNIAYFTGNSRLGYWSPKYSQRFQLHPSSVVSALGMEPEFLVFQDVLKTPTASYITGITPIEEQFLEMLCPHPSYKIELHSLLNQRVFKKIISPVGSAVMKDLIANRAEKKKVLESEITKKGEFPGLLEICSEKRQFVIYATKLMESKATKLLNDCVKEMQEKLTAETKEIQLGGNTIGYRILIGAGGEALRILEPDEFSAIQIEIHEQHIGVTEKCFEEIKVEISEKLKNCAMVKQKSINKKETSEQRNPFRWGMVHFNNTEDAQQAIKKLQFSTHGCQVIAKPQFFAGRNLENGSLVKVVVKWSRRWSQGFGFIVCKSYAAAQEIKSEIRWFCRSDKKNILKIFCRLIDKSIDNEKFRNSLQEDLGVSEYNNKVVNAFIEYRNEQHSAKEESIYEWRLRERLAGIPYESIKIFPIKDKKAVIRRACILFASFQDAEEAVRCLNGPGILGTQDCSAAIELKKKFYCKEAIFPVIDKDLKALQHDSRGKDVEIKVEKSKSNNNCKIVTICGKDSLLYKMLLCRLQSIVEGKVISNLVVPSFLYETLRSKISDMETKIENAKVDYDRRTKQLLLFGKPKACTVLEEDIKRLFQSVSENETKIHLRGQGRATGLMKALMQKYGNDLRGMIQDNEVIQLNIRRHEVMVVASDQTQQRINTMINEVDAKLHADLGGLKSPGTQNESIGYEDCCLCLCKADILRYALEVCGHLYCVACVNDLLETSERNKSFPITCCSEGCSSSLVLRDIENLIKSGEQQGRLAEAALSNLVQTNPKLYSYCPTPDCPMVYKVSEPDNAKPFTCPKCFRKTCTACHNDAHVGFKSCTSWKEYNIFEYNDNSHVLEWARGKNIRECPKCNNLIEENGGCMHVSCNCGAHICWRCMKTFSSSGDCYDHLGRCGGIFPGNMDPPVLHPEALQAERGGQPRPFLEMRNTQGAAFQIAARNAVQNEMPRAERRAHRVPQYHIPEHGRIGVRDGLPQHQIPEHDRIRVRNVRENEMARAERQARGVPQYHIPEHG
ncbi:uncharacterized protein LOC135689367 [Rhopilema esculentum]|uniref:uncharacterized protein LOC135689367 n=1 Tax=Rhopilema esculentum TaxID=499914 RepID=UPI0031CFDA3B